MSIKQVRVSVKRLIALKKFENVTYECEVVQTVEDGQSPHEAYDQALSFCKAKVLAEMDRIDGKVPIVTVEEDYVPTDFKPHQAVVCTRKEEVQPFMKDSKKNVATRKD